MSILTISPWHCHRYTDNLLHWTLLCYVCGHRYSLYVLVSLLHGHASILGTVISYTENYYFMYLYYRLHGYATLIFHILVSLLQRYSTLWLHIFIAWIHLYTCFDCFSIPVAWIIAPITWIITTCIFLYFCYMTV